MIRVFICDDQRIVVDGLHAILDTDPEIDVVGVAYDGAEALERLPEVRPDVVLMDLKMPVMDGIQATRKSHQGKWLIMKHPTDYPSPNCASTVASTQGYRKKLRHF